MSETIFLCVLFAALLDASQHYLIKSNSTPAHNAVIVAIIGGALALPFLAVTGPPEPQAWPYLCASTLLTCIYWLLLGQCYRTGALSLVFPLARGGSVLLIALFSHQFMAESLRPGELATVAIVILALLLLALQGGMNSAAMKTLGMVALLALSLASFIVVDGIGVRMASSALAYGLTIEVTTALGLTLGLLISGKVRLLAACTENPAPTFCAASMTLGVYLILLDAMQVAPIALVSALSETSIAFAVILSWLFLSERVPRTHMVGAGILTFGVCALHMAG